MDPSDEELIDGYRFQLHDLRGRMRGLLRDKIAHHAQVALDAAQADPPYNECVVERLENILIIIEREMSKLT